MASKEEDFRTRVIALFKSMNPDIPVVNRYQNVTQPSNIRNDEAMADILIERFQKVGTDYMLTNVDGNFQWIGDRLVHVTMEVFAKNALSILTDFRDRLETFSYREMMNGLGIMEQRIHSEPRSSTRLHGSTKYVESAIYNTRFHATVSYIDGIGKIDDVLLPLLSNIEHGTINGDRLTVTF
jgi:hypothetical protein